MKNFTLGPSKDLLGHLKIFKICYLLRSFAGTILCLELSNRTLNVVIRSYCVPPLNLLMVLTCSLTSSNSLGVSLKLGVFWGNLHYLRLIDQSKMTNKHIQRCNIERNLINRLNVFRSECIYL